VALYKLVIEIITIREDGRSMSTVLFNTLDLALLFTIYQCVLFAFFLLLIKKGRKAKPDFIGWSGLAPINYLIKHAIGLRINAPKNEITWRINEIGRHGIEGLRFNGQGETMNSVNLIAQKRNKLSDDIYINVQCRQDFVSTVISHLPKQSYQIDCQKESKIMIQNNKQR